MKREDMWLGLLIAWVVVWLGLRLRSKSVKLRYFKFWGNVPKAQKDDNLLGFGMTAFLLVMNLAMRLF